MSFISPEFAVLLAVVLILLALFRPVTRQKWILLVASCVFYAYWDWRFLGLLLFVVVMDYSISVWMAHTQNQSARKALLITSVTVNLLILGFFKYFNFFTGTFNALLSRIGWHLPELQIILPIGISFYTFITLGYVIDTYHGHIRPAKSLLDYAVFLTFFPRILSGPIVRASEFLPQIERGAQLNRYNFVEGARLFGQGLIKKVVVADTLAMISSPIYSFPALFDSITVWLGVLSFAIQIYFDFSGYSDMAIGVARVLGFELPINFDLPYTSKNVSEFWRRWHISLSFWLRDYIFFPVRRAFLRKAAQLPSWLNLIIPIMVTMLLCGLWHGAGWNFVLWGGLQGAALSLDAVRHRDLPSKQQTSGDWIRGLGVFMFCVVTFVVFQASAGSVAWAIVKKMLFINPSGINWLFPQAIFYISIVLVGGFFMRARKIDLARLDLQQPYILPAIAALYLFAFLFTAGGTSPFIYFQF